jgi:hypothetical protein
MRKNARIGVVLTILMLGPAGCGGSGDYSDPSSQAVTAESSVLPTVTSQPEETTTEIDDAEPTQPTIDGLSAEEETTQDQPQSTPDDDEVQRANRWNGYDLDCADFSITDIPITGSDPNGLDREGDGVGCET